MVRGGLRRTWRLHSPFPLFPIPASPAPGRLEILDALAERALDGVVPVAAFVDLPDQVAGGVGEVGVEGFLERADLADRHVVHVALVEDRKSVVSGTSVSVSVDLGGGRIIKKKKTQKQQ